MSTVGAIRAGLATNLDTIADLRVADYIEAAIQPPMAVVGWPSIEYDETFGRGVDVHTYEVRVYVAGAMNRTVTDELEPYLDKSGAASVKAAIEADGTLGGACSSLRVTRAKPPVVADVAGVSYIAVDFDVEVIV